MLTPSEFAGQYRAGKPKASNKEVARAYNAYVENNSVDDSELAASPALDLDTEESTSHSMKDNPYGVERNEYSKKLDQKVVSAIDALAKLFHLKVRFGDLGGNNGLYHADTGLIELDIDPQHSGASNGFLFSVSHEIGHAVKVRIGAKAWEEFADYAVKAKSGEKTIKAKQESAAEYSEYAVAREEVVCDFIGELLSEQKTLDIFCESIKGGEIKAETARGIVAAWRKFTGILRGKGVKQADTATAALVQRVQEQFNTDIETAENAVRKMQKALSAAMKTEKNTANESGVKHSEKTRTQDKSRWEERHKWAVYEAVQDALDHGDNGDDNLIKIGEIPPHISDISGVTGDFYVYRDHLYENMVDKERAIAEHRKTERHGYKIDFHALGEDRIKDALLSLNKPLFTIAETGKDGNPELSMVLPVNDANGNPL